MAPMNALTGLVMLAAVTRDLVGAAPVKPVRSLQEGVLDTEFTVEAPSGEEFVVDISTADGQTPVELIVPPSEKVSEETLIGFDSEGHLTEVSVGDLTITVTYDEDGEVEAVVEEGGRRDRSRRATTQAGGPAGKRNLQTENEICRDECRFATAAVCDTLDEICFGTDSELEDVRILFQDAGLCDALTFLCTDTGLQANCANTCAVECDPDFGEDDCVGQEICNPVLNICEIPELTGDDETQTDSALVDAGEKTTVTQVASAYDTRISSDGGCDPSGCTADLTRDGSQDGGSRWSCSKQLDDSQCTITYEFDSPQDIVGLDISFFKGDERTRKLKVTGSGGLYQIIESSGTTSDFESFEINTDETTWLTLEALGLGKKEWISFQEVRFMVA